MRKKGDRHHFLRGRIERADAVGDVAYTVRLSGGQSSAMLSTMHRANCLISLPADGTLFAAGSVVECIRLDMEDGTQ